MSWDWTQKAAKDRKPADRRDVSLQVFKGSPDNPNQIRILTEIVAQSAAGVSRTAGRKQRGLAIWTGWIVAASRNVYNIDDKDTER